MSMLTLFKERVYHPIKHALYIINYLSHIVSIVIVVATNCLHVCLFVRTAEFACLNIEISVCVTLPS